MKRYLIGLVVLIAAASVVQAEEKVFYCPRIDGDITVDGLLDDPAWKTAPLLYLGLRYNISPLMPTSARLLWTNEVLLIAFECDDLDLLSTFTEHDSNVWQDGDCVEVFLNPLHPPFRKVELQINPGGAMLDIGYEKGGPGFDVARLWNWPGATWAAHYEGTLNDNQRDTRWTAEMRLPWTKEAGSLAKPAIGDTWAMLLTRVNRVALDARRFGRALTSWPALTTVQSFHYDKGYGRLVFVDIDPQEMPINGYLAPIAGVTGTHDALLLDHRSLAPQWSTSKDAVDPAVVWQTHPMPAVLGETVSMVFIGKTYGNSGKPTDEQYLLSVNGKPAIHFTPHRNIDGEWSVQNVKMSFVHGASNWQPSGVFTLTIPSDMVEAGQPATLSVTPVGDARPSTFAIRQWTDAARHAWHMKHTPRELETNE